MADVLAVVWMKKVCSCSAAEGRIGSKLYIGAVTGISFCIRDYPTEDFFGHGQKLSCGYWILKVFGGLWKDCGLSRKQPFEKENF
jgi:hypothetical protein